MMGTNYYARENYCEHCQRGDDLHIGKSSGGWCFALHVIPERGLNTLDEWKAFLADKLIFDEYGDAVDLARLLHVITVRGTVPRAKEPIPVGYSSWEQFHTMNHSCDGPNGLVRHALDGGHCVRHGEGTWDYVTGEFS